MLSPNTLLNKGRYRIDAFIRSTADWTIYSAMDQASSQPVLSVEYAAGSRIPSVTTHDGLMPAVDSFLMNGRHVEVTEPISLGGDRQLVRAVWDRFAVLLMGLNSLSAASSEPVEISPETLVRANDGRLKLLPLPASAGPFDLEAWYIPLEGLWQDLDHISQKAIYNSWDLAAVEAVERARDESSAIYSLAAIFYRELTGVTPIGAFERTVVELDGSDPLAHPSTRIPELGTEASEFLLRCMSLRRTERFASFEEAVMNFPSLPQKVGVTEEEIDDLLEMMTPASPVTGSSPRPRRPEPLVAHVNTVEAAETTDTRREEVFTLDLEPSPIDDEAAEETIYVEKRAGSLTGSIPAAPIDEDEPIFSAAAPNTSKGFAGKLAIAAVGLVALGGGVWGFFQYSAPAKNVELNTIPAAASIAPADSPALAEPLAAAPDTSTTSVATDTAENTSEPELTAGSPSRTAVRAAPKTPAAAKPTPAQTAKKKVTVDDLINDN